MCSSSLKEAGCSRQALATLRFAGPACTGVVGLLCAMAATLVILPLARGAPPDHIGRDRKIPSRALLRGSSGIVQAPAPYDGPSLVTVGTGDDVCLNAVPVDTFAGPAGNPNVYTINGDNSTASVNDCGGLGSDLTWWEAIRLDKCSKVTLDLCGTWPALTPAWAVLFGACPCNDVILPDSSGRGAPICSTANIWMTFDALASGTYYYPVYSVPGLTCEDSSLPCVMDGDCIAPAICTEPFHPYEIRVTVEECTGACTSCLGACCEPAASLCTDAVTETTCVSGGNDWYRGQCCEVECRPSGPTYDALDVELLSRVPVGDFSSGSSAANDIWGYTSPLGQKYAILGLTDGTGFVRITDPRNPVVVADIADASSTWSDIKVYGEYAYNVNETSGGMQIIDLTQIDGDIVTLVGTAGGGMSTAHNVAVNADSGYLYPCGTDAGQGFLVYDLANAASPQLVGSWNNVYVHDLQVVSFQSCPIPAPDPRNSQPCEIAFTYAASDGFIVVDVTDKLNMQLISTLVYPTISYTHQGWLSEDGRYAYMNDELDEFYGYVSQTASYVIDVQDLTTPTLVTTHLHDGCWVNHNEITRGDRLYQAHYAAGLRVLDVSNPVNPAEVAYFDTHPEDNDADSPGAWGVFTDSVTRVILVSDMDRGLFVLCDELDTPLPGFVVDQNPATAGVPVAFDASSSDTCDPTRSIVLYEWDFSYDGVTFNVEGTGVNVTHTFSTSGPIEVALRVTDQPVPLARASGGEGTAISAFEMDVDNCISASDCGDSVSCTDDLCVAGVCQNPPNHARCDDAVACTVDTCDGSACQHDPVDCSGAGDTCNVASCDPIGSEGNCDTLTSVAEGAFCDDGLFCTAPDTCSAGVCVGSGSPCAGEPCNEDTDTCGSQAPDPLVAVDGGNRYIRVIAPPSGAARGVGGEEAIRVRFVSLDGYAEPDDLYLGAPFAAPEEDTNKPDQTFRAAPLSCDAVFRDWSVDGIIAIYGGEIMPGSEYQVQRATSACAAGNLGNKSCWSEPVTITTLKYGDIWPLFHPDPDAPQPDFNDIAAMVRKFQATGSDCSGGSNDGLPCAGAGDCPGGSCDITAPLKTTAQLRPNKVFPQRPIDFKDIAAVVNAFTGTAYSSIYNGPCACPSSVTCGTTPCQNDLECVGAGAGLCVDGFCTDKCGRCTP